MNITCLKIFNVTDFWGREEYYLFKAHNELMRQGLYLIHVSREIEDEGDLGTCPDG